MREKGRSGAGAPTSKKGLYMRRECAFFKTRRIGIVLKGTFYFKIFGVQQKVKSKIPIPCRWAPSVLLSPLFHFSGLKSKCKTTEKHYQ